AARDMPDGLREQDKARGRDDPPRRPPVVRHYRREREGEDHPHRPRPVVPHDEVVPEPAEPDDVLHGLNLPCCAPAPAPAPAAASGMLPWVLPKVRTMKATSSPSRKTPLKARIKAYQSIPARGTAPARRAASISER